jgi:hypothetical protein
MTAGRCYAEDLRSFKKDRKDQEIKVSGGGDTIGL